MPVVQQLENRTIPEREWAKVVGRRVCKGIYWIALVGAAAGLVCSGLRFSDYGPGGLPISASSHMGVAVAGATFAGRTATQAAFAERTATLAQQPLMTRQFLASSPEAPSVHASTITMLPSGDLLAAWFGGSREGAKDVSIYLARWTAGQQQWQPPHIVTDRAGSASELGRYVKKLGNPVLHCDSTGRVWLYYVTVSVGGWSGGSISVKYTDDQGRSWSDARRLITTPFLNASSLVRASALSTADRGVLLPTYHEFIEQFGEVLHLDAAGHVVQKYRMNSGTNSLQPTLVAMSATELFAFYRRGAHSEAVVYCNRSTDGGQSWSPLQRTNLPNPNASIAATRTHSGEMLMALNPAAAGREQLAIASSDDGLQWTLLEMLESGAAGQEYSYPTLIRGRPGVYHLTYTWNREKICHVSFNDAWLESRR